MTSSSPARARRILLSVTAIGAALALTSCAVANSDTGSGSAAAGDTLRIVLPQEPPTLEPCDADLTSVGIPVRSNITQPLVERDATTGELEPLLATDWEATGETEWTFTLQDGVTFQDGTPFDAEAAAHSIDRAVNGSFGCDVEGYVFGDDDLTLEAVDALTLKVTTAAADPILPLRLSFVEMVPTSTDDTAKVREPIGTGPYKIASWDAGTKLNLSTWDGYWGEAPAYANVEYQWRSEGTVRAAMITGGEADVATGLGPDDGIGELGVSYPNNETVAIRFDGTIAPFTDIRVREAVNYAIDRSGINDSLYGGDLKVATQLIPSGVIGFNDEIEPWPFDLDKAKSLVAEAKADGVPVDTKITLVARNGQFPRISEMAQVLQAQLAEAGLNVELKMVDTTQSIQYQTRPFVTNEGPIALMIQHGNQAGDAAFTVESYMKQGGSQSTFGSDEFDTMLDAALAASGDERQTLFADAFAYQNENIVQFAPVVHQVGLLGLAAGVDYTPDAATGDEMRLMQFTPAG